MEKDEVLARPPSGVLEEKGGGGGGRGTFDVLTNALLWYKGWRFTFISI